MQQRVTVEQCAR